jgi:Domain of unknown function (DUF4476)
MKNLITTTLIALLCTTLWGQSHNKVTFFAVEGEPFTLILNGKKINKEPQTSVTDSNASKKLYVKIIFEDADLGEITDNFSLGDYYDIFSYSIKTNKKGIYKINRETYDSSPQTQVVQPPPPPSPQQIIVVGGNGNTTIGQCYVADTELSSIINLIQNQISSARQLETARTIISTKNQCLTSAQIKQIVAAFSFDSDRLTLAKYGYDYAKDRSNYYTVGEALSFFKKQEFMLFLATK